MNIHKYRETDGGRREKYWDKLYVCFHGSWWYFKHTYLHSNGCWNFYEMFPMKDIIIPIDTWWDQSADELYNSEAMRPLWKCENLDMTWDDWCLSESSQGSRLWNNVFITKLLMIFGSIVFEMEFKTSLNKIFTK